LNSFGTGRERTLCRRFLVDCLVIRAAQRDDVYSYIHGQTRIGFVRVSGHRSRPLALFCVLVWTFHRYTCIGKL
jgi:hypothetical protein